MKLLSLYRISLAAALLAAASGCIKDDVPVLYEDADGSGERVSVRLDIKGGAGAGIEVRSPMLEGSEEVMSGAHAYVFYSESGLLDSVQELSVGWSSSVISVPAGNKVDIFVLGNLWAIEKDSSRRAELSEAMGSGFPSDAAGFSDMVYRLDGGSLGTDFRREALSDVRSLGIPFSGELRGISFSPGQSVSIECDRLFSKVSLTIDHSGLNGGNPDYFRNVRLHIRQANCVLRPFGVAACAESAADMIEGDYDPSMREASSITFDFYVPENMQGDILPGNTDQGAKAYDNIAASAGKDKAGLLTYVEFTGEVDASAGGYGGEVTYRFYLGKDAVSNCDLERNRRYDVRLGFKVSSLFDPYWQVDPSFTDGRTIGIASDRALSDLLPSGQLVAVRKNRPAKFYVYVGTDAGLSPPSSLQDRGYNPQSVAENALSTDFMSKSNVPEEVPLRKDLLALGITPTYDDATGLMTFSVTDPSLFRAGEELILNLSTVPEGKDCSIRLVTLDNMSESWDSPLSQKMYQGSANRLVLRGYAGEAAVMSSQGIFKFSPTSAMNSDFIPREYIPDYCKTGDGAISIYRFYRADASQVATISIRPLDTFNDGTQDRVFNIRLGDATARFDFGSDLPELDIRGTPVEFTISMYDAVTRQALDRSMFDDTMFGILYAGADGAMDFGGDVSDADGPYIAIEKTGRVSADGYGIYNIFRSRIGTKFKIRADDTAGDCVVNFRYQYNGFCDVYREKKRSVLSGRKMQTVRMRMLPFMSDVGDVGFAERFDDYTLWNADRLDPGHSLGSPSDPMYSSESVKFYLASEDYYSLYAKPLAGSSYATSEGRSPNIVLTQDSDGGALKLVSRDDGATTLHSAGPHAICASVENIHSGEILEEVLGEFDVFVHFIVGLNYDSSSIMASPVNSMLSVYPLILSDVGRTSYAESASAGGLASGPSVRVWYSGRTTGELSFQIPFGTQVENCRASPMLDQRVVYAGTGKVSGNYLQVYEIRPEDSSGSANLMDFVSGLADPAGTGHQRVAFNLGRNTVGLQFANPEYWDDGDSSAPKGADMFDRTAFGDLTVNPDARVGDPDYGKGYYVFERLGDVMRESSDWIPYFNWLTR